MRIPNHPSVESLQLSKVFHALSDPNRLRIVKSIATKGEEVCTYYSYEFNISKSTVSHHIKTLRESGVIRVRVEGSQHFYSIRMEDLNERFPGLMEMVLSTDPESY
ncbi:metalloregulator ArsR/SmtB family transcription factor [Priestia sp. Y58]|uniref:ArsR/SmtB family transcription factor n=1 Tax=Priestia TaxID=2800373 RepID=UPI001C8D4C22|nr:MULTISPECIES: metalloregulator ArsR/SmtB family transcription factor [Priestia]MBX9983765.1 helix-turn-helix transcriptional regulator [Priestia aryabhattai]MBY0003593.1 helix-turn-helix transcriptional regulator [Priestia aryabhattai]MCZ8495651.1 metalloregulator ArsR/SmtB family transcription factor [Priestia megaterium]MDG0032490.1 metalloregulator ArsR/SmtB family transcription factor [Priestia sp. Y58]UYV51548.1 metalloregulator ArsR/SmtB family transcription factor [Priestia megateriu